MDTVKVGLAIKELRQKAGLTQKALADRLLVSDKAVSKWERGLGLPDISCLRKLSILLDTDTDSLLAGETVRHASEWCGILYLEHQSNPGEMICDKPLIDYLLSYFMLVGIRKIAVVCTPEDCTTIRQRYAEGDSLGICLSCFDAPGQACCTWAASFQNCMILRAPLLMYSMDMTAFFQRAMMHRDRIVRMSVPMGEISDFPPVFFDENNRVVPETAPEKKQTRYPYRALPLWFCPGKRVEECLSGNGSDCYVEPLNRGFLALDVSSGENRSMAAGLVDIVRKTTGLPLCDLREIARNRGML